MRSVFFPWRKEVPDEFGYLYPRLILRTATVLLDMVLINLLLAPFSAYLQKFFIDPKLTQQLTQTISEKAQASNPEAGALIGYAEWRALLVDSGLLSQYVNYNLFISFIIWMVVVLCWTKFGTTPAKWIMGLKIVDLKTGNRPTRKQFIIRSLVVVLSILPLGLGYLWIISQKQRRTWHDLASGTVVIKTTPPIRRAKQSSTANLK